MTAQGKEKTERIGSMRNKETRGREDENGKQLGGMDEEKRKKKRDDREEWERTEKRDGRRSRRGQREEKTG